jgi:hypothetical protein
MSKSHFHLEPIKKPLLDLKSYRKRQFTFFTYAIVLILVSLFLGMLGYKYIADLDWVSSFYNASMILTGMGPAAELHSDGAKIFAGCYSIFSGVIFLGTIAVMFAPMVHRFLHRMHIEN